MVPFDEAVEADKLIREETLSSADPGTYFGTYYLLTLATKSSLSLVLIDACQCSYRRR